MCMLIFAIYIYSTWSEISELSQLYMESGEHVNTSLVGGCYCTDS